MPDAVPGRSVPAGPVDGGRCRRGMLLFMCGLAVLAAFFALYSVAGTRLSQTTAFSEDDILFELDTPRVIGDMTLPRASHYRTKVHPLYVMLANPWGVLATKLSAAEVKVKARPLPVLLEKPGGGMEKTWIGPEVNAAVLLNSFLGAAGVALGFVFFLFFAKRLLDAALLACLFGLSASQLFLSVVPDTASLAICSLLVTYILFLRALETGRSRLPVWILAGVFSLGVTTTNLAQTVACFAVGDFVVNRQRGLWRLGIRLLGLLAGVLAVAAALAMLQRALYPSSNLFFLPDAYREDLDFASLQVLRSPLPVLVQLFRNFSWINFIAPTPSACALPDHKLPGLTFASSLDFSVPGIIAAVIWFGLWLALAFGALRRRRTKAGTRSVRRPLAVGLLLCLLFNLLLHSVYGVGEKGRIEYFLYTGNFSFLVLALWALPLSRPGKTVRVLLLALVFCMGINNLLVFSEVSGFYAGFLDGNGCSLGPGPDTPDQERPWTSRHLAIRLPPVPEPGDGAPPPCILLRLIAPSGAPDVPVRVSLGSHPLPGNRVRPGAWFLAVPWRLLETARREAAEGDDALELVLDADEPIPDDLGAEWMRPGAPLEMSFDPAQGPTSESYLSWANQAWRRLRNLDYKCMRFPVPIRSSEFDGEGTISLPPGLDGGGADPDRLYIAKLTMNAVCGDDEGRLAVSLSLPEFPDIPPQTVVRPHSDRRQEFRFVLAGLPRAPERLGVHVDHEIRYPRRMLKNPRHANVQMDALQLHTLRRADTLTLEVGTSGDAVLLGDGFFGRESPGSSRHGRWTGGECDIVLPLKGDRDYRLTLDYDSLRPEAAPPADLRLELDGHPLETAETDTGLEARLPAEWLGGPKRLVLRTGTWSPEDFGAGDTRRLGIYLRAVRAEPI